MGFFHASDVLLINPVSNDDAKRLLDIKSRRRHSFTLSVILVSLCLNVNSCSCETLVAAVSQLPKRIVNTYYKTNSTDGRFIMESVGSPNKVSRTINVLRDSNGGSMIGKPQIF